MVATSVLAGDSKITLVEDLENLNKPSLCAF